MNRALTWLAGGLAVVLAIGLAALLLVDTAAGHRWVVKRINAARPENGLRLSLRRINGSLYNRAVLRGVAVRDPEGLILTADRAELVWRPVAWIANRLDITALVIPRAKLHKLPRTRPTQRPSPILPDFDIRIGRLSVDQLTVAPAVTGRVRAGRITGNADIRHGLARVTLAADVAGSDMVRMRINAEPARDRFDVAVRARGAADGLLSRMIGARRSVALDIGGVGRWAEWRGQGNAVLGGQRIADLVLAARAGDYELSGTIAPALITGGALRRLTTPQMLVSAKAQFAQRRLLGTASLRSPALTAQVSGGIDLGANAWRDLRITVRLLRPSALIGNMRGNGVTLRAILDGSFATARFDYRLTAPAVAFDRDAFQDVRIAGRGRLSPGALVVPVRLTARRITGSGDVASAILGNLSVDGALRIAGGQAIGNGLKLRTDKLTGRVNLRVDLTTGRYQIDLDGGLQRYLIPGLGLVDVASTLRVVPGAGGRGTRVVGEARVQVVRLDNAFFRSLTGGLPRITAQLERGPDKVLYFRNMVLVAPSLRLTGTGSRTREGIFTIDARGAQARYGALTLRLGGRIERPTIDLLLPSPNAALGLSSVRAHLDPIPEGYRFTAAGGSRLGPFAGEGQILLPRGASASIAIARLDVSGTRASGMLDIVLGGFAGRLAVTGGGLSGVLDFAPQADVQRIAGRIDATNARIGSTIAVRRARTDFSLLLDPAGTVVSATGQGSGLKIGGVTLARFAGSTDLRDGTGEVRAAVSGSRGRGFDIRMVTQVTPDTFRITAQGTLDRRPIALTAPAVLTRDGNAWRLAPVGVTFAGGTATISGRFGEAGNALDAALQRMPLSVLDIGYPGLGLSGNASGKLSYATAPGAPPTGRVEMAVRGLSRAGLLQSSRPIDLGVTGVLDARRAAMRAVMASGGTTIGRAQAVLSPLATGDLPARLAGAGLFAQLRYSGPADTLWRLTGVELFDLSGPVAIAADLSGRVGAPAIRGVVRATGARIESATTGTVFTNVQAAGRFGGSRLAIDRFTADAGRGGRVSGTGQFEFANAGGVGMDLSLQAQNAVMINRDDIGATVTGPLTFRSDGRGGTISGDVRLDRSRYRLGKASAAAALPRISVREINLPGGGEDEEEVRRTPWQLAITARAPGNVMVSGLGLSSEWSAHLRIAGQPDNPAITGRADLVRGDVEFAGREFELERGVIRFDGEVPANPALDIEANADTQGLNASIRVTGAAQKPEIVFASTPALPQDELLSRLLFGTSITNLSAPEALQLAAAVAALQDGGNGLNPINAVRRAAGLDRLRILPADPQTGQGTAIAAGKYVTRRLYAEIVSDAQGYSATRVEYQVTRWLSLLSSISTLGRQSANVRVSRDY